MKKGIKIGVITLLLLLTGCTIGGSFFMLNYSLRPEAKIRAKNADSYPFMYKNYPFLRPWVDSLNQAHALRDTFVLNPEGIRHMLITLRLRNQPKRRQSLYMVIQTMPFACL